MMRPFFAGAMLVFVLLVSGSAFAQPASGMQPWLDAITFDTRPDGSQWVTAHGWAVNNRRIGRAAPGVAAYIDYWCGVWCAPVNATPRPDVCPFINAVWPGWLCGPARSFAYVVEPDWIGHLPSRFMYVGVESHAMRIDTLTPGVHSVAFEMWTMTEPGTRPDAAWSNRLCFLGATEVECPRQNDH